MKGLSRVKRNGMSIGANIMGEIMMMSAIIRGMAIMKTLKDSIRNLIFLTLKEGYNQMIS